jgi:pyruvate,water dikinase
VSGRAYVVVDPTETEDMRAGDILVTRCTDPSWTPLLMAAGGLVLEVGGTLTHGSVAAREYGIPAVVGVSRAATIIQSGDQLIVDGSTGRVTIVREEGEEEEEEEGGVEEE